MNVAFPFRLTEQGRTQTTGDERHIRQMLELLLCTAAGERVNRPDFGGGLTRLLFAPGSPELAATVQHTLRAEVIQWMGDLVELRDLDVSWQENRLTVVISYVLRRDGTPGSSSFVYDV